MIALPTPAAFSVRAPIIASVLRDQLPPMPADCECSSMKGPDTLVPAARTPVLRFAGCTYYALGFRDGREAMAIVAYNANGVQRQCWVREGARNLWDITVDEVTRTVTFHGQRRSATREPGTLTMGWDELVPLQPIVSRRARDQVPFLPRELVYGARPGPDAPDDSPACPVLRFGAHTYWPFNFRSDRLATGIVACDAYGRITGRWDCDGARHIWQVTSDPVMQTVTFHGQRLNATRQPGTVTLPWDELWIA